MYVGTLFMRGSGGDYNSPTFPRGGLAATFAIEVFMLGGTSPTLECDVEHKNIEDTSFTTAGSFASMTTAGVKYLDVASLKEEVRLVFTVGGSPSANMVYANVLPPQWRPY
jgi:hypothetical protein